MDFMGDENNTLDYENNWSALMPVVEKIESLGYSTSFKTSSIRINAKEGDYMEYVVRIVLNADGWLLTQNLENVFNPYGTGENKAINKKIAIYKAVVFFITWYNEQ